jgi:hypothetical protein
MAVTQIYGLLMHVWSCADGHVHAGQNEAYAASLPTYGHQSFAVSPLVLL